MLRVPRAGCTRGQGVGFLRCRPTATAGLAAKRPLRESAARLNLTPWGQCDRFTGEVEKRSQQADMTRHRSSFMLYLVSALAIALLFVMDLVLPGGPAPAIGYCAVVVLAGMLGRRSVTLAVTLICIVLTGLGYGLEEPNGVPVWLSLLNTGMVMVVIAMTGALTLSRQRSIHDLQQRTEELARSNRDLEHFAAAVSHDLRSPLLSISGSARLLEGSSKSNPDSGTRELLGFIQESVARMTEMINRMLRYARVGAKPLEFKRCDLNRVLEQVLKDLRAAVDGDGVRITHDPLPTVQANELLLAHVFQNLIENAIKYRGQEPPKIHVSSRRGPAEWVISIRDNGKGIPPQHLGKIFDLFERAGENGSQCPGSGVGLATCKKIIERHGGRIWVESQVGVGSTFHFALPDR
jgi:signal transduction histidine kinase